MMRICERNTLKGEQPALGVPALAGGCHTLKRGHRTNCVAPSKQERMRPEVGGHLDAMLKELRYA